MNLRDGMYFVSDNRTGPFLPSEQRVGAICRVSFSGGLVFIASASQPGDGNSMGTMLSYPTTVRAPAFESFEDRHAIRTPQGEVLLIWPTLENFRKMVDLALASISTGDYAFPSEAELATEEGRQAFLRQFVEA